MAMKYRFLLAPLLLAATVPLRADVRLPALFSDHAVLQRAGDVPVWGRADAGERVTVAFAGAEETAIADDHGKWKVRLDLQDAPKGPHELIVSGNNRLVVADVLVGEVWLCSGQSNMGFPVKNSVDGAAEVAAANDSEIRFFKVARNAAREPAADMKGKWQVCSPQTVANFSAVGYFYGRELRAKVNAPVGLIDATWGGTPAEAWTPAQALESEPDFAALLKQRATLLADPEPVSADAAKKIEADWIAKVDALFVGESRPEPAWWDTGASSYGWRKIRLPGSIDNQLRPGMDGSFWLRKTVEVPASAAGEAATLHLGVIDDYDFTWVNGKLVGRMTRDNPDAYRTPRAYPLPAGTLRAGANVILVRVVDWQFLATVSGSLRLETASGWKARLEGQWLGRIETDLGTRPLVASGWMHHCPGALYDGMIAPLTPYALRGVIWYQGENNADMAVQYRRLFPTLIASWRERWGRGDLPFYYVQLANYMARLPEPAESSWAELREAQLITLQQPRTGMAVAIDIGEENDIHPRNKQEVARRLSLIALANDYGFPTPGFSGPRYRGMQREGPRLRLTFDGIGGGLVNRRHPEPPEGFSIAGEDGIFVWARAEIEGADVIVSSDSVPEPIAVRYGWADNPAVSLYNAEGLPAGPFRTDRFPEVTAMGIRD